MKFGSYIKRLADPKERNHYIAYDVLKKAINAVIPREAGSASDPAGEVAPHVSSDIKAVNDAFGSSATDESKSCRPPDSRFHELLRHELAKVNRFAALQVRTLVDALREAQRPLLLVEQPLDAEALSTAEKLLDGAAEDLVKLEHFRRLNFTGFRKIVKKFDKRSSEACTGTGSLASWFVPQLLREFFVAAPLDSLLLALAWGYSALRRHRRGLAPSPLETREYADSFYRSLSPHDPARQEVGKRASESTTTFWLMPNTRMRALCTLVKRFELTLPPRSSSTSEATADTATSDQQKRLALSLSTESLVRMPRLSTEVSLVYYDSPSFPLYKERLVQAEGGGPAGFRCRRTKVASGSSHLQAGSELIERDGAASALYENAFTSIGLKVQTMDAFPLYTGTDNEGSLTMGSVESVVEKMQSAGAGESNADVAAVLRKAARNVINSCQNQGESKSLVTFALDVAGAVDALDGALKPMATVGSCRVLLRGDTPATQGVRIALDEDVQFSQGPVGPAVTAPSDAIDFPYFLLEVASGSVDGCDSWLDEVRVGGAAIRSVPGFSTGAHAVAALHRERVPELPHWFSHLAAVETTAPTEAWGLTLEWRAAFEDVQRDRATSAISSVAAPEDDYSTSPPPAPTVMTTPAASGTSSAAQPFQRLEPKNFLASERTMLEWMHTVLALAFLGLGLWRMSLSPKNNVSVSGNSTVDDVSMLAPPPPPLFGLFSMVSRESFFLSCYSLALVFIAIVFAWYAVLSHISRCKALFTDKHTERVFNSRLAPTAFAASVGVALFVHMVIQIAPMFFGDGGDASLENDEIIQMLTEGNNQTLNAMVAAR